MKALPLIALAALTAAAGTAADERPPAPFEISDLTFSDEDRESAIEIRSQRGHSASSVALARLSAAEGLAGSDDGPVRFVLDAEAGRTECRGARRNGVAKGICTFTSSPTYEVGLAQRGIALEQRRDLLALALVDARLALVDDLSRQDLSPRHSGNLIAAAALEVTGAWAREIREAGLRIETFHDLIAARALKVDAAFLRGMAQAGYPRLSADQAVAMKAVGVTPSYAAAMNRATDAAQAIAAAGELQ